MIITLLVMVMMSYFGFRLEGFRFQNQVQWFPSGNGLQFGRYAVAYTQGFFSDGGDGVSIEFAIESMRNDMPGFQILLMIHDGDDGDQLIIGQWRSTLIVMNGNDYSNKRRLPRIAIPLNQTTQGLQLVSIVSNSSKTMAYLDGDLKVEKRGLVLKYPSSADQARLVVANNLKGSQSWIGKIAGLALYDHALDHGCIKRHHRAWSDGHDFSVFKPDAPKLLYAFDQKHSNRVNDLMGTDIDLMIPKWFNVLDKCLLSYPKLQSIQTSSFIKDIALNLIGFIPFGILFAATLTQMDRLGAKMIWFSAVLVSFGFSLTIEVVQAWLPSRDSSVLDLILNSLGGLIGALFYTIGHQKNKETAEHQAA